MNWKDTCIYLWGLCQKSCGTFFLSDWRGKSSIWIDMHGCTFCPFVGTFFVQIEHGRRSPKVHQNRGATDCSFSFASMIRFNCCICKWRVLSVVLCISGTGGLNINLEGLLVRLWIYFDILPADSEYGEIFSFRISEWFGIGCYELFWH